MERSSSPAASAVSMGVLPLPSFWRGAFTERAGLCSSTPIEHFLRAAHHRLPREWGHTREGAPDDRVFRVTRNPALRASRLGPTTGSSSPAHSCATRHAPRGGRQPEKEVWAEFKRVFDPSLSPERSFFALGNDATVRKDGWSRPRNSWLRSSRTHALVAYCMPVYLP
jgi:hypothetical protein